MNQPAAPGPQPNPRHGPVPAWVWGVLTSLVVLAALALALAWLLPAPQRPLRTEGGRGIVGAAPFTIHQTPTSPSKVSISLPAYPPTQILILSPSTMPTPAPTSPTTSAPRGKLAIVIDDMGADAQASAAAIQTLPPAITFAFLPHAAGTASLAPQAHAAGHELLVHIPMEPLNHSAETPDPGPHALRTTDSSTTIQANLTTNLTPLAGLAIGVNNHMGSAFTRWQPGMELVLNSLHTRGMFFLDSKTTTGTATAAAARAVGFTQPLLSRDVFLDDTPTVAAVAKELAKAVRIAQKQGYAIAIGHPHPATLQVLAAQLPGLSQQVQLVPISHLAK